MEAKDGICQGCGQRVTPTQYHPIECCISFKAGRESKNSTVPPEVFTQNDAKSMGRLFAARHDHELTQAEEKELENLVSRWEQSQIESNQDKCPECGDKGQVPAEKAMHKGVITILTTKYCPTCHGTGKRQVPDREKEILVLLDLITHVVIASGFDHITSDEAGLHFADVTKQIIALSPKPVAPDREKIAKEWYYSYTRRSISHPEWEELTPNNMLYQRAYGFADQIIALIKKE